MSKSKVKEKAYKQTKWIKLDLWLIFGWLFFLSFSFFFLINCTFKRSGICLMGWIEKDLFHSFFFFFYPNHVSGSSFLKIRLSKQKYQTNSKYMIRIKNRGETNFLKLKIWKPAKGCDCKSHFTWISWHKLLNDRCTIHQ